MVNRDPVLCVEEAQNVVGTGRGGAGTNGKAANSKQVEAEDNSRAHASCTSPAPARRAASPRAPRAQTFHCVVVPQISFFASKAVTSANHSAYSFLCS